MGSNGARLGRCDPHMHTTYSDGLGTPREVLDRAVELGLDVIAITDHDTVDGALEAREMATREAYPLDVIVGGRGDDGAGRPYAGAVGRGAAAHVPLRRAARSRRSPAGAGSHWRRTRSAR